jgi:hypothetical protein
MKEIWAHLDLSIFAQMALVLFLGVFVSVLIRVIKTPRHEAEQIAQAALCDDVDIPAPGGRAESGDHP